MRFSVLALAAAATLAAAQNLGDIPSCAISCFAVAVPASGCSLTDTNCQCTTGKDQIQDSLTKCVPGKCDAADIAKIAPAVSKLCASAGITISDLPTAAASASGASNTASATGSVSKTASGGTSATSGAASSTASGAVQETGAAVAHGVGLGAMIFGLAAAML
ncbi:hypothetical protein PMIN06_005679 [Paraphaeosphaeria minitans]|uniref:CFEM domain-containing protein n=1 Tax=Paraphaeosphaeria minitans TaxID=565426 RepID=A0A9P6GSD4_9PLEO|nr:hypothetical protein PMIN01_02988 [Paraphaeosphaeria minitans]